ncbi:PfkB family carbohydrate kinase [Kribbella deserti]|uniref:PfkB family carbohydrate kinase n=1 Tax=Kribbella deserti TaxID=1926257 RepID=A0ABV6QWV4_9ACTN
MRLLHLGNVVIDLVLTIDDLPARGGDVIASSTATTPGGGFNVMAAAVRLGLPVGYGGAHGTGPFGELAREALTAAGIEVVQPITPGIDTGFVVTLVEADGERTFVTSRGAESTLTAADLDRISLGPDDLVYLSGYGLMHPSNRAALVPWLSRIPDDVLVYVDPGPLGHQVPADDLAVVLARTDWWSCNEREASDLTNLADPAEAARVLLERTGRRGVVVRLGSSGCLLAVRGAEPRLMPGFAVEAVDLNGAGDAHAGAFLAALAAGADPAAAASRANAAAALAVTRRGPATGPTSAELDVFLRS